MYAVHRLLIPKTELPHSLEPVVNGMVVDTTFRSFGHNANAVTMDLIAHLLSNYMPKEPLVYPPDAMSAKEYQLDIASQLSQVTNLINDVELVTVAVIDSKHDDIISRVRVTLGSAEILRSAARARNIDTAVLVHNALLELESTLNLLFSEKGIGKHDPIAARLDILEGELHGYFR